LKVIDPKGPITMDENNATALEIEAQMEELQTKLSKKKYRVKTTTETMNYLMDEFYADVPWAGYECYAIGETHAQVKKVLDKAIEKLVESGKDTNKISFTIPVEILEALFHFVKQYPGKGVEVAAKHRLLAEDLSVPMSQLNQDRNELRDLAMEAEAAKHGITVEEYKNAASQMQGAPGMQQ
jgi:ElaB/YqjD/DUF883 family membrane-anchored ribosome-binding protein